VSAVNKHLIPIGEGRVESPFVKGFRGWRSNLRSS